ncbi:hypothetical protein CAPTEDRAFT_192472 [Capitella teleta]|uniref:UDP-glucuronosyltransferase n=1 Tax=Capitella teleta TaxID=283909 RepID=R7U2P0_CAPTE|nr:hypothetical protein CAPTEDRAFT_192472 [Capitella teleta]|eukprot:ELU00376.1 hypothetical protein CAPTEDRAFT_192472 [Capitella teleta]
MQALLLCLLLSVVNADRVLLIPMQFPSRRAEMRLIGEELVKRGHQVHMIIPEGIVDKMSSEMLRMETYVHPKDLMLLPSEEFDQWIGEKIFDGTVEEALSEECAREYKDCVLMLDDTAMLKRLEDMQFHLAIADGMYMPPCYFAVAERLRLPFVSLFSDTAPWWMGLPVLPSFKPTFTSPSTDSMTLNEKLYSLIDLVVVHNPIIADYFIGIDRNEVLRHVPHIQGWGDLYSRAQIYLVTVDHLLDWPSLSLPNTFYLPGITLKPPQPLQGEILQIAQSSSNGFIVTVIFKISRIPDAVKIPSNVITLPWIPQNDLLGHENAKLFITHCGNNGQHESVFNGVPMVGFPLFLDQFHNAHRMQAKGLGVQMDIKTFTADQLYETVQEVIVRNASYSSNARRLSRILRSRPMLPLEEATHWVEHVLQFGASHLRSVSLDMAWYQMFALDVIGTVMITMLVIVIASLCICKTLCCRSRRKTKTE